MVRAHVKQTPEEKKDTHKKRSSSKKKNAEPGAWPCKVSGCTKVFAREADLKRHQRTTKFHSVPGFSCPQCDSTFTRTDALRRHQKSRHNGVIMEPLAPRRADSSDSAIDEDEDVLSDSDHGRSSRSASPEKEYAEIEDGSPPAEHARASTSSQKETEKESSKAGPSRAGPSSYYRPHTLYSGYPPPRPLPPPPGIYYDPNYHHPPVAIPTSATRFNPPGSSGPSDTPPMPPVPLYPVPPPYYAPSPYYRHAPPMVPMHPDYYYPHSMHHHQGMPMHPYSYPPSSSHSPPMAGSSNPSPSGEISSRPLSEVGEPTAVAESSGSSSLGMDPKVTRSRNDNNHANNANGETSPSSRSSSVHTQTAAPGADVRGEYPTGRINHHSHPQRLEPAEMIAQANLQTLLETLSQTAVAVDPRLTNGGDDPGGRGSHETDADADGGDDEMSGSDGQAGHIPETPRLEAANTVNPALLQGT